MWSDCTRMASCELFVGNVPTEVDEEELKTYFDLCTNNTAQVHAVELIRKYRDVDSTVTGFRLPAQKRLCVFAFLTMTTKAGADAILESRPHSIRGVQLVVTNKRRKDQCQSPEDFFDRSDCQIWVGGLNPSTTTEDLKHFYESNFGTVTDCIAVFDTNTGKPRCYGFVTFEDSEVTQQALADKLQRIQGHPVTVRPRTYDDASRPPGIPKRQSAAAVSQSNTELVFRNTGGCGGRVNWRSSSRGRRHVFNRSPPPRFSSSATEQRRTPTPEDVPPNSSATNRAPYMGLGHVMSGGRVVADRLSCPAIFLKEKDKSRFVRHEQIYVEAAWREELQCHEANFVAKLQEGDAELSDWKETYGYLDGGRVFFPGTSLGKLTDYPIPPKDLLKIGDLLHYVGWDQNEAARGKDTIKAERVSLLPMTCLTSNGKSARFGVIIDLSTDGTQGILYCTPLGKILIDDMATVANRPIEWTLGDRIIFDEYQLQERLFECNYLALDPRHDPKVRMRQTISAESAADGFTASTRHNLNSSPTASSSNSSVDIQLKPQSNSIASRGDSSPDTNFAHDRPPRRPVVSNRNNTGMGDTEIINGFREVFGTTPIVDDVDRRRPLSGSRGFGSKSTMNPTEQVVTPIAAGPTPLPNHSETSAFTSTTANNRRMRDIGLLSRRFPDETAEQPIVYNSNSLQGQYSNEPTVTVDATSGLYLNGLPGHQDSVTSFGTSSMENELDLMLIDERSDEGNAAFPIQPQAEATIHQPEVPPGSRFVDREVQTEGQQPYRRMLKTLVDDARIYPLIAQHHPMLLRELLFEH